MSVLPVLNAGIAAEEGSTIDQGGREIDLGG